MKIIVFEIKAFFPSSTLLHRVIHLQIVLIISGNLSFLNWLTIVPSLACFDDQSLLWMFSKKTTDEFKEFVSSSTDEKNRLGDIYNNHFKLF